MSRKESPRGNVLPFRLPYPFTANAVRSRQTGPSPFVQSFLVTAPTSELDILVTSHGVRFAAAPARAHAVARRRSRQRIYALVDCARVARRPHCGARHVFGRIDRARAPIGNWA